MPRHGAGDGLTGIGLEIRKGGAGINLETIDLAIRRQLKIDAGEGETETVGQHGAALGNPLRELDAAQLGRAADRKNVVRL